MDPSEERSGSMLLRAWLEGGAPDALRVRVFSTIGTNQATPIAASTPEAVHAAVQDWLDALRSRPDNASVTPR